MSAGRSPSTDFHLPLVLLGFEGLHVVQGHHHHLMIRSECLL